MRLHAQFAGSHESLAALRASGSEAAVRKPRKKYTAFEKALLLLPKLSVVECLILRDAIDEPGSIDYIRHSLKHQCYRSWKRTLDPNAPVEYSPLTITALRRDRGK
jgi:hypothetical protein